MINLFLNSCSEFTRICLTWKTDTWLWLRIFLNDMIIYQVMWVCKYPCPDETVTSREHLQREGVCVPARSEDKCSVFTGGGLCSSIISEQLPAPGLHLLCHVGRVRSHPSVDVRVYCSTKDEPCSAPSALAEPCCPALLSSSGTGPEETGDSGPRQRLWASITEMGRFLLPAFMEEK